MRKGRTRSPTLSHLVLEPQGRFRCRFPGDQAPDSHHETSDEYGHETQFGIVSHEYQVSVEQEYGAPEEREESKDGASQSWEPCAPCVYRQKAEKRHKRELNKLWMRYYKRFH